MSNITAAMVKELRERTGSAMMDCKKALTETNGDMEAAIDQTLFVRSFKLKFKLLAQTRLSHNFCCEIDRFNFNTFT